MESLPCSWHCIVSCYERKAPIAQAAVPSIGHSTLQTGFGLTHRHCSFLYRWRLPSRDFFLRQIKANLSSTQHACVDGFLVRGATKLSCKPISIHGVSDHFPLVLTVAID